MRATRTTRNAGRRSRPVKRLSKRMGKRLTKRHVKRVVKRTVKPAALKAVVKPAAKLNLPLEPVLYKLCKPGWAVLVDRTPNAMGTRFVCPFCPRSHRVSGPVRGFKKMRHAQWGRLRRVEE